MERYQQLLVGAGIEVADIHFRPSLEPPAEAKESAARLWREAGLRSVDRVVGLASGADCNRRGKWIPSLKRWSTQGYAEVVRWLVQEAHVRVVMFGDKEEARIADEIAALGGADVISFCGKTSLGELQWLIRSCAVLVCNDTGTMHLAAALGTPVVALFGPTSPTTFGPLGEEHRVIQGRAHCSPCWPHPTCDLRGCIAMDAITPSTVIDCLAEILSVGSPTAPGSMVVPCEG